METINLTGRVMRAYKGFCYHLRNAIAWELASQSESISKRKITQKANELMNKINLWHYFGECTSTVDSFEEQANIQALAIELVEGLK